MAIKDTNRTLQTRMAQIHMTTAQWAAKKDVVLKKGEIGVEDLGNGYSRIKVGDGTLTWENLKYATAEVIDNLTSQGVIDKALSANQGYVLNQAITTHTGNNDIHVKASDKDAWNAKYDKPGNGIPETDLAADVQASLALADSAVQSVTTGETAGTIKVDDEEVEVAGLGSAAFEDTDAFVPASLTPAEAGAQVNVLEAVKIGTSALTITNKAVTLPEATTSGAGLMSADDKAKVNGIEAGAEVNVLEGVQVNGTDLAISNKKVNVTVATGSNDGTIKVNGTDVEVKGLKSAAYTESTDYATAAQGALADTALQKADIIEGTANGTINVDGENVAVHGLGGAAYKAADFYVEAEDGKSLVDDTEIAKLATVEENAEKNIIEIVKVNGTALTPAADRSINVVVPSATVTDVQAKHRDAEAYESILDGTVAKLDLTAYALKTDLSTVFKFKGACTGDQLAAKTTGNEQGDVWFVTADSSDTPVTYKKDSEYAWDGTKWVELGGIVDLSGYQTKADAASEHAAIESKITNEEERATAAEGALDARLDIIEGADTVDGSIKKALKDAKDYADGLDSAMDARVDALETDTHTHDNKTVLDGITSAKVTAWDGAATKAHEHDNKTVLDGITSAKVTAWDAKYDLPTDGIPKDDLDADVQASLALADSAVQAADIADKADKDKDGTAGNAVKLVAGGNYEDAGFATSNIVLDTDYILIQGALLEG